jgi:hypothetical protein
MEGVPLPFRNGQRPQTFAGAQLQRDVAGADLGMTEDARLGPISRAWRSIASRSSQGRSVAMLWSTFSFGSSPLCFDDLPVSGEVGANLAALDETAEDGVGVGAGAGLA